MRTDDEVYRVDAVWLGPPKATFPWRARYVAWGVGIAVFLLVMTVERQMGIGFGFFSTAWAFVATLILTRFICARISHERPLSAVLTMWGRELTAPREVTSGRGGASSAARLRVTAERPRRQPKQQRKKGAKRAASATRAQTPRQSDRRKKEVRGVRTPARP
ncbi:Na+/melibiose symporter-like transporter [Saccharothrix violaceirubra]|uniref:Na+/melibiose symporter-like transporter n=1 Tax=Saccharothrix violaceirubra TaxID=413306 RepID=A0A7W7T8G3_9PSEU|nr:Na+/melibiose symporter-like transporter [Saccharothrix violaceirubra]